MSAIRSDTEEGGTMTFDIILKSVEVLLLGVLVVPEIKDLRNERK